MTIPSFLKPILIAALKALTGLLARDAEKVKVKKAVKVKTPF